MEIRIAEIIAIVIILFSVLRGLTKGMILTIYSMVRIILLLIVTMILTPIIVPILPTSYVAREGVAFLIALVLAGIALHIVATLLKIIDHIPVVGTVNKLGGAIVGFVWGLVLVWIALLVIGAFQDVDWCQQAAGYIRQSPLLMQIQAYNPLPIILKNFNFPIL